MTDCIERTLKKIFWDLAFTLFFSILLIFSVELHGENNDFSGLQEKPFSRKLSFETIYSPGLVWGGDFRHTSGQIIILPYEVVNMIGRFEVNVSFLITSDLGIKIGSGIVKYDVSGDCYLWSEDKWVYTDGYWRTFTYPLSFCVIFKNRKRLKDEITASKGCSCFLGRWKWSESSWGIGIERYFTYGYCFGKATSDTFINHEFIRSYKNFHYNNYSEGFGFFLERRYIRNLGENVSFCWGFKLKSGNSWQKWYELSEGTNHVTTNPYFSFSGIYFDIGFKFNL